MPPSPRRCAPRSRRSRGRWTSWRRAWRGAPSGRGALGEARSRGVLTIGLACREGSPLEAHADIVIAPVVGPEVIAGSSRLKAGTAQKLVLNMLSTATMIRLGKVY